MTETAEVDPRHSPRIDAILREALDAFDAPIAFSLGTDGAPARAYASVPVTSPAGAALGTLCILGPPRARAASLARLPQFAGRIAAVLSA